LSAPVKKKSLSAKRGSSGNERKRYPIVVGIYSRKKSGKKMVKKTKFQGLSCSRELQTLAKVDPAGQRA